MSTRVWLRVFSNVVMYIWTGLYSEQISHSKDGSWWLLRSRNEGFHIHDKIFNDYILNMYSTFQEFIDIIWHLAFLSTA